MSFVIFGPQKPFPSAEALFHLRLVLLSDPRLASFVEAIKGLLGLWYTFLELQPDLKRVPGIRVLGYLNTWIKHGDFPQVSDPLPNVLLTPLTIISHIAQYVYHHRLHKAETYAGTPDDSSMGRPQGVSIGILSAFAISCSTCVSDISDYGAVALRLAMCLGAFIDLEGAYANPPDETLSFTLRCDPGNKHCTRKLLGEFLDEFPEVYVSMLAAESRMIITAPAAVIPLLTDRAFQLGLQSSPFNLQGRFHTSSNTPTLSKILSICKSSTALRYPPNKKNLAPMRTDTTDFSTDEPLHEIALRSILMEQSNWHSVIEDAIPSITQEQRKSVLGIDVAHCVLPLMIEEKGIRFRSLEDFKFAEHGQSSETIPLELDDMPQVSMNVAGRRSSEDDIAVVGMACRFPGANSIEEFWDLMRTGKSMHAEIPAHRFSAQKLRQGREFEARFWSNLLDDIDSFDHRFFNISPREAAAMDPQQRIMLELAYDAMESSGYFDELPKSREIGCFLGVGSVDYQDNVASHPATAFSALGTLRAFISGRISHFFGWTGPSIIYDTACSSSALAIHAACKAIQSGECQAALAGGINIITSPHLHHNLVQAGFLSTTGPSKVFDAQADGYCRGEGGGLVVLKKLSRAMADGDFILGVIAGSAVNQSGNSTSITIPDSSSQSQLYQKVVSAAGIDPLRVSYVEAHGTGTPVGDPIEALSIRDVFGGSDRMETLYLGSVKANIGHTEAASGVAALIKAILMLQKAIVPMQANFSTLNPHIAPLQPDRMEIPITTQTWKGNTICLNNYGAAGSNAAIIVCRAPVDSLISRTHFTNGKSKPLPRLPILLSAHSASSLHERCIALARYIATSCTTKSGEHALDVESMAFGLAHKTNPRLNFFLTIVVSSLVELEKSLRILGSDSAHFHVQGEITQRSVILCFGGQVKDTIGLSESVYESTLILRMHLDRCEHLCRSFGVCQFYPAIFSKQPIQDIVLLHCMLFSIQYACASSWIHCGLQVKAVVGHSFGHFAALCISGSTSLEDTLRLVIGRARLIQNRWGSEKGAMLSIEADDEVLKKILSLQANSSTDEKDGIEIACYNGPTSHVLVGSKCAVACIEKIVATLKVTHKNLCAKRLDVTHGFNSYLMDPLIPELTALADTIKFHEPKIPVETSTRERSCNRAEPKFIATHSRQPVYFHDAIRRLEAEHESCLWLEAGSGSGIINLIRHAARPSLQGEHAYQPIILTHDRSVEKLADATVHLWNLGVKVQFWPYHRMQRRQSPLFRLPSYPFGRTKHWLEYKESQEQPSKGFLEASQKYQSPLRLFSLVSFIRPQTLGKSIAEFQINPENRRFEKYVQGHVVLKQGICPASLYLYLATKAASTLIDDTKLSSGILLLRDVEFTASLGLDPKQRVSLLLEADDDHPLTWSFRFSSHDAADLKTQVTHAVGIVYLQSKDNTALGGDSARDYSASRIHCSQLLTEDGSDTSVTGSFIYKAFSSVVEYSKTFQGLRKVAWDGLKVAGRVLVQEPPLGIPHQLLLDPIILDNFIQVAGFYINCLRDKVEDELYICTKIAKLDQVSNFQPDKLGPWEVLADFESETNGAVISNIVVFDLNSSTPIVKISGAHFVKVQVGILAKSLSRTRKRTITKANSVGESSQLITPTSRLDDPERQGIEAQLLDEILAKVRTLLNKLTDVPTKDMQNHSRLESIGIDSLMTIEVLTEIDNSFSISIPMHEFQEIYDLESLCLNIRSKTAYKAEQVQELMHYNKTADNLIDVRINDGIQTNRSVQTTAPEADVFYPYSDYTALKDARSMGRKEEQMNQIHKSATALFSSTQISKAFLEVKTEFDRLANETEFAGFITLVRPRQTELIVAYVVEAFEQLGCSLCQMRRDESLPHIPYLTKHDRLMARLRDILEQAALIRSDKGTNVRTERPIDHVPCYSLSESLTQAFPIYSLETRLLESTGSRLADCLSGKLEATHLIFGKKSSRDLLEEVYTSAPIFATGTKLLICFLSTLFGTMDRHKSGRILEIGAGTGATTKPVLKMLDSCGLSYSYTFTDLSPSLVATAKKNIRGRNPIEFTVLDAEATPPQALIGSQDVIISTNVMHATRNLVNSLANARALLKPDGVLCLVELTRNLDWFDLSFGLLDGWWRFEDSRNHAIADELLWSQCLLDAGFGDVDWTIGDTDESNQIRLIIAHGSKIGTKPTSTLPVATTESSIEMETILFKDVGRIPLYADVWYPRETVSVRAKRSIALMIHGGGHVMLSRKDIRPGQTKLLLDNGFLPISIDHRLCPEVDLLEGPMTDICHALEWARHVLPTLPLQRSDIRADGNNVVAVGWSTGGTLAMSLGWLAPTRGLKPPEAILAFYCPTDYAAEWWKQPHYPWRTSAADAQQPYDLWDAVRESALTGYNVSSARTPGGWMSTTDARARIPLHCNWTAQTLPMLLGAMTSEKKAQRLRGVGAEQTGDGEEAASERPLLPPLDGESHLPQPSADRVAAISPLAQIVAGNYRTPTFLVHGSEDDFIPWEQTQTTYNALVERNVPAGIRVVQGGGHMFEMLGIPKNDSRVWAAVLDGYEFLRQHLSNL